MYFHYGRTAGLAWVLNVTFRCRHQHGIPKGSIEPLTQSRLYTRSVTFILCYSKTASDIEFFRGVLRSGITGRLQQRTHALVVRHKEITHGLHHIQTHIEGVSDTHTDTVIYTDTQQGSERHTRTHSHTGAYTEGSMRNKQIHTRVGTTSGTSRT